MADASKILMVEGTAPVTPASGKVALYCKSDHIYYSLGSDGIERSVVGTPGETGDTGLTGPKGDTGSTGAKGDTGSTGAAGAVGASAYNYIAYASSDAGADFTTTFNPVLNYIAVKSVSSAIVSPQASDFAGLWKNYKGSTGETGLPGAGLTWKGTWDSGTEYLENDAVEFGGSSYVSNTTTTNDTPGVGVEWDLWVAKGSTGSTGSTGATGSAGAKGDTGSTGAKGDTGTTGSTGAAGASAYNYIAYSSTDDGTGFTSTFNSALNYIAVKSTTSPIVTPQASDFAGLWKNYKGATGDAGAAANIATDTLWDAVGDLVVGTGANTAGRLAKGSEGKVLTAGASTLSWETPSAIGLATSISDGDVTHAPDGDTVFHALAGKQATGLSPLNSQAVAENDVLVGAPTPFGNWVKKTIAEFKTILGLGSAAYTASTAYDVSGAAAGVIAASISDGDTTHSPDGNSVFDALALKAPLSGATLTGATINALTPTAVSVGFTIAGGTTSKTLTVPLDASVSGTNTGDYTHPTGDGNHHVPANSTTNSGKVLTAGASAGTYTWETISGASIGDVIALTIALGG